MTTRPLQLDYVVSTRRIPAAGIAVLVLALAGTAMLLQRYRDVQRDLEQLRATKSVTLAARPPVRAKPPAVEDIRITESIRRELTLPWATIVRAAEKAATRDVALLQLQPQAQQALLRVTAEARDPVAMLQYLRRLRATGDLTEVHLITHQVQVDDPQRPIQFAVQARLLDRAKR